MVLVAGIRRRQSDFEKSLENHHEAAAIDPYCSSCFVGAAFTHLILRDYEEAERDIANAETAGPLQSYAHHVAALTRISGFGDLLGARELLLPSYNDNQLIRMASSRWGMIPRILGDFNDRILSMRLEPEVSDTVGYYLMKAQYLALSGYEGFAEAHYDTARVLLEGLAAQTPDDPQLRSRLGLAYAGLGRGDDAIREGTKAIRLRPISEDAVDGADACESMAQIFTMLGELDSAIDRIEMLLSVPSLMSVERLRLDPIWEPLREEERYRRLFE